MAEAITARELNRATLARQLLLERAPLNATDAVTAFHALDGFVWEGLAAEARALVPLLADREPEVYGRYHHWWAKLAGAELPDAETRLLPGA